MPTAVVTGASAGIGKGVTERLLRDGWNVIMMARSTDKMNQIISGLAMSDHQKYKIITCDLSKPELLLSDVVPSIASYLDAINSRIDLLLNNAGGVGPDIGSKSIEKLLPSFNWHINLMLATPYLLSKYLSMKGLFNDKASVINVGSLAAHYGTRDNMPYPMAKAGVQSMTKCLAFELSRKKGQRIRVNNLELGYVRTDFAKQINPNISEKMMDMFYKSIARVTPLQRCGTVQDIVELVLFLCDEEKSGWITGQNIVVDGGVSLPLFHARPKL